MSDPHASAPAGEEAGAPTITETIVESFARWSSALIIVAMLVLIFGEVIIRYFFHRSWEGTDEFGGYLLVALTFTSLPVTLARGGFHQMQFVRARLTPRGIVLLDIILNLMALAFMLVLVWQFWRLGLASWRTGDTSMTAVRTPLWMPRAFMILGSVALSFTLIRFIMAGFRQLRSPPTTV
jgi:TRAP-type C4-dicarboxylate transport system permease small subunit